MANHEAKWINEFAKKHQVIVICQQQVDVNETGFSNEIIQLYDLLPGVFPVYPILQKTQLKNKISKILKKHNIEIIHSMYAYPYALYANWFDLPKIITTRGSDVLIDYNQLFKNPNTVTEYISYFFYRRWFENAFRSAASITSTSYRQQEVIKHITNDSKKLNVIRTGINTTLFKIEENILSQDYSFIFSPRLMKPLYNIDQIFIAFSKILTQFPNLQLIQIDNSVGNDYSNEIHALATSLNIDSHIVWKPFVDTLELIELYQKSCLVVMIPDSDGTPNSALEAMLLKVPVIIGNVPYDEDIFNESTIWQINSNHAEMLSQKMIEVLKTPKDKTEEKLNNAYTAVLENATLEKAISKIETIYQSFEP